MKKSGIINPKYLPNFCSTVLWSGKNTTAIADRKENSTINEWYKPDRCSYLLLSLL
jgi:hypothetical protein